MNPLQSIVFLPCKVLLCILCMTFLSGCNLPDISIENDENQLNGAMGGDDDYGSNSCGGILVSDGIPVYFSLNDTIDNIDMGVIIDLPKIHPILPCICAETMIEVKLNVDISNFEFIGIGNRNADAHQMDTLFRGDPSITPKILSGSYTFFVQEDQGDNLFIQYKNSSLLKSTGKQIVQTVRGICMVDNIHDPHVR